MQVIAEPRLSEELPAEFLETTQESTEFSLNGTIQLLDDCSPKLSFEQINIYSDQKIRLGADRILRHVVLPYRVERSSRGYTLYRRIT